MSLVRTWLPVAIIVAGVVLMVAVRDENGLEGGILLISAGLSVWLLNFLYRVSVRGDRDRDREAAARAYFDAHGLWPDEAPGESPGAGQATDRGDAAPPGRDVHRHPRPAGGSHAGRRERPPRRPSP